MLRRSAMWVVLGLSFLFIEGGLLAMEQRIEPRNPAPTEWTVDDLLHAETADQWSLSPDGDVAVWVKTSVVEVDGEEKRLSNLYSSRLTPTASSTEAAPSAIALTRGRQKIRSPLFSPDGERVAFLSDRQLPGDKNDKLADMQLWVIPIAGGEAYPITRSARDIQEFGWRDDETLVVLAQELPSAYEKAREEAKDTSRVVDDELNEPPVRLFTVASKEGSALERLTDNQDRMRMLRVAPDGRRAAVVADQSLRFDFDEKLPPHTYLVDLQSGRRTRLFDTPDQPRNLWLLPIEMAWAPDSGSLYLLNWFSNHAQYRMATVEQLWVHDVQADETHQIPLDWKAGSDGVIAPVPGGVIALMAAGVGRKGMLYQQDGDDWRRIELTGEHVERLDELVVSRDGSTVVYRHSTATRPPQWFRASFGRDGNDGRSATLREVAVLTNLNPGYRDKPNGRVEVVHWTGARGDQVEGLLHFPLDGSTPEANPREPKRAPLIVDIHGGPSSSDRDSWSQSYGGALVLLRQRGAYVLQVNYHGSTGYGLEWVESIGNGKYYELETVDIETGVDAMIERGYADPERLALYGWSNGGILAADLITRTDRYRAASIGAADVEWFSDWANIDFGAAFDNYYLGGPPWENVERYLEKSPFFRLTEVTTPTIIYTGTADRAVPPHQSWSLFRALQYLEQAPVRLVLFPGEPHSLGKQAHRRRKVEEDLAWFDRYLFERERTRQPWLRPDSRLAALLGRNGAARTESGSLGQEQGGVLTPETVALDGLEVGRFEVTREQWAAFTGQAAEPGSEELPATKVTYEQAKAYVQWLRERTGRHFRLPTEAEAKRLAASAGGGGNTLDYWAGYSPNPEDAQRLMEQLASTLGEERLLLPVGSLPGLGEDPVFDLDGNVAEWADGASGGVAVGASADRPAKSSGLEPQPAYIGLRVVVGVSKLEGSTASVAAPKDSAGGGSGGFASGGGSGS